MIFSLLRKSFGVFFCFVVAAGVTLWTGCEGGGGIDWDFGANDQNKVICLGDSITGEENYDGVAPYPAHLAGMRPDKTVINKGRGGESSGGGAGRVGRVLKDMPGYLCILYGANDAINSVPHSRTISNLRSIITNCKMNKTYPILATCTPMSKSRSIFDGSVKELNAQIRQLAEEEGVALVDLEYEFAGANDLFPDGLHPNEAGCVIIAAAFADSIE
jgi:lysophospholipase L1-like esterase